MTLHLSFMLWLPAAVGLLAALFSGRASARIGLLGALGTLAYAVVYAVDFDSAATGLQYITSEEWIPALGISYKLGVDGLNLLLILLTAIAWFGATLWTNVKPVAHGRLFYFWLGLGQTSVLGALLAQDLVLFVVFFDLMLVPFFFLTLGWGGTDRVGAVTKLVIYTLVGSLLMLTAAAGTGILAARGSGEPLTFDLAALGQADLSTTSQQWLFLFFAAAFLVKMPAIPLHGWLRDGYSAMPLPVLALFSGVLSKVAAYGFLRVSLPLFPDASAQYQELMLVIAVVSILYGSLLAFSQTNARLILGYSSIAQLGFITLGIFAIEGTGAQGAILQSVTHGLVTLPALFILVLLAERAGGSEDIRDMGGIAFTAPILATFFVITSFALLAMPGSPNFVGEFMILLGVFKTKLAIAVIASLGVVLAAVYALRLFIAAAHNRVGKDVQGREMSFAEGLVLVPLVLVIVALGLYPQFALERGERAATAAVAPAREILGEIEGNYGATETGQQVAPGTPGAIAVDPSQIGAPGAAAGGQGGSPAGQPPSGAAPPSGQEVTP
jgi:NADH-quinone oxidoreductase subunit M